MRLSVVAACLSLCLIGISSANDAHASIRKETNIPAEGLGPALNALAKDRNFQIVYVTEEIADVRTGGAVGELTTDEALKRLLTGTGLTYRYLDDKTVTIGSATTPRERSSPKVTSSESPDDSKANQEGKKSSSGDFRVAQVDQGKNANASSVGSQASNSQEGSNGQSAGLAEIVVTAQKRNERLIDTPESVSVLSADDLSKLGATQLRDFANTVPGLVFSTSGAGYTQLSMRGVTSGIDVSPTVGIYVDDVPYGSSSAFASGAELAVDVGLFDLDRIEVLHGPQGTLYGASTMGGLIKYVTKQPDSNTFSGGAQAGVSATGDGGGVNYNTAAAVNLPISTGIAAVRVSGYESHDGGYIHNVALDEKDVNRSNIYGGRVDFLLTPTEPLTVRLTGLLQDISRAGEGTADYGYSGAPLYGSLDQYRLFAEPFDQQFRLVSGTVTYNFGPAILTSVSSYQTVHTNLTWDLSAHYVPLFQLYGLGTFGAVGFDYELDTKKFTEEMRLASASNQPLEWLIGGFYTHESSTNDQAFILRSAAGQSVPNNLFTYFTPTTYQEYAGFGDLTWHITTKFDVTGGARYARNNQEFTQYGTGALGLSAPTTTSSEHVVTYLATARYHFSDSATGYLRYATGYRPGGPNVGIVNPSTGLPSGASTFKADSLRSYEAGIKTETTDKRFGADLAVYHIDWSNIQIVVLNSAFGNIANAPGGATVNGLELTLSAHPVDNLVLTGAFAYQHAYLKESDADLGASAGERLPNVPRFTAAINGDYVLTQSGVRPTIGATFRYVSDREASFDGSGRPQYDLPSYAVADLRTAVEFGSATRDPVNLQVYVHNLLDKRGEMSSLLTEFGTARVSILQPRTIGVLATVKF